MFCRPAVRSLLAFAILGLLSTPAAAQTFCVVPPDTSWRPVNFGFELQTLFNLEDGRVADRSYPIIRKVSPGSPADSAGLRDGDILAAVNGFDVIKRMDSSRTRGPGIPTRLTIRRGDSTIERTIVGLPAPQCKFRPGSGFHGASARGVAVLAPDDALNEALEVPGLEPRTG